MLTRILLNPTPTDGGAPAAPVTAPAPPPAPAAPAGPQVVTIPYSQFEQFQAQAQAAAQFQAQAQAAERASVQALADKQASEGHWKTAAETLRNTHAAELKAREDAAAGWERRARSYAKEQALATELAGLPIVPGAARQLMQLIGGDLEAHPDGDGFAVRTATFQGAGDYLRAELAKPEYAHFLVPSTTGGAGATGGSRPGPAPTPAPSPANMGEAMIAHIMALRGAAAAGGPVGLGPR